MKNHNLCKLIGAVGMYFSLNSAPYLSCSALLVASGFALEKTAFGQQSIINNLYDAVIQPINELWHTKIWRKEGDFAKEIMKQALGHQDPTHHVSM